MFQNTIELIVSRLQCNCSFHKYSLATHKGPVQLQLLPQQPVDRNESRSPIQRKDHRVPENLTTSSPGLLSRREPLASLVSPCDLGQPPPG